MRTSVPRRGFTFVEIMVGVVIIGLMAAGTISAGFSWYNQTRQRDAVMRAKLLDLNKSRYASEHEGTADASWAAAPTDQDKYALLSGYLKGAPLLLGDGTSSGTWAPRGYRFTLNGLNDATRVDAIGGGQVYPETSGGSTYTVAVSSSDTALGTALGGNSYVSGETATVNAAPFPSATFVRWEESGVPVSTSASYTFTVTSNRALTAVFAAAPAGTYSLTMLRNNATAGTVSPGSGAYAAGAAVTLGASPNTNWVFDSWTGDIGTANASSTSISLTMDRSRTVQANFVRATVNLVLNPNNNGWGSVAGGGALPAGTMATATSTAFPGYIFKWWLNGATVVSSSSSYTLTVTADTALTAVFEAAATTGVTPGTYGDATNSAQVTVDAQGRVIDARNVLITATLPDSGVAAGSYGSASSVPNFIVNAKGLLTSAGSTPISIAETQVAGLFGKYVNKSGDTMTGSLGIGGTASSPLHAFGGSAMTAGWNRTATLDATFPVLAFNGSNGAKWAGIGYDYSYGMRIWVNSGSNDIPGGGTIALNLLNNGNVGVKSGTPGAALDVGSSTSDQIRTYGGIVGNATANINGTGASVYMPSGFYVPAGNSWLYGSVYFNGRLTESSGSSRWVINSSDGSAQFGGTVFTGKTYVTGGGATGNSGIATSTGFLGSAEFQSNGPGAAMITFHRPGYFAGYLGLDTDNQWKVGGWSMGANAYTLLHAGNYTSYSPSLTGSGASGLWGINISGNAATASVLGTNGGHSAYMDGLYGLVVRSATPGASAIRFYNSTGTALNWVYSESGGNVGFLTPGGSWLASFDNSGSLNRGTVPWGSVTGKPSYLMYYQGFTLDANTMDPNSSGFTYSVNAPYTGPIARLSEPNYSLELNGPYNGGGTALAFRTRNGDASSWNAWHDLLTSANYTNWAPSLTGSGASGTWGINISGNSATTSQRTFGNVRTDGINRGSYGSVSIGSSSSSWAGIDFTAANLTLMVRSDYTGFYTNDNAWVWRFNSSGVLDVGTVPWGSVSGRPSISGTWNWSGQSGQPTWLWGSNDGSNMYVWNPSNFSVNYANSAGNANTVGGYTPVNRAGDTMTGRLAINASWLTNGVGSLTLTGGAPSIAFNDTDNGGCWAIYDDLGNLDFMYNTVGKFVLENNGNGHFEGGLYAYGFTNLSSRRFKRNITRAPYEDVFAKALKLELFGYNYTPDRANGKHDTGLIAEEVQPLFPDFVSMDKEGKPLGIDYGRLGAAVAIASANVVAARLGRLSTEMDAVKTRAVTSSSRRFKTNIRSLVPDDLLKKALAMQPVEYDYLPAYGGRHSVGLIAEDVAPVLNSVVSYDKEGRPAGLEYGNLAATVAIGSVQVLKRQADVRDERLAALEKRLAAIETERPRSRRVDYFALAALVTGLLGGAAITLTFRRRF